MSQVVDVEQVTPEVELAVSVNNVVTEQPPEEQVKVPDSTTVPPAPLRQEVSEEVQIFQVPDP